MQSMTELMNGDASDSEVSDVEKIEPLTETEFISTFFFLYFCVCRHLRVYHSPVFLALSVRKIMNLVLQVIFRRSLCA
jgi:hypothetical protein